MRMNDEKYFCTPANFWIALTQVGVSKIGYELIGYMQLKTYKRSIRDKTTNMNPLDWIEYKQRKINRECWGRNNVMEVKRAVENLAPRNIIVFNEAISKVRINYKPETWNIY